MSLNFDVIVVGGGPAGLGAASAVARQDHTTALFDSREYRNAKGKYMHTVPTWDHRDPNDFRSAARADFERYGALVTMENAKVDHIRQREDGTFEAVAGARVYTGKKVVLATGVKDVFPDIHGYSDCWGSGM